MQNVTIYIYVNEFKMNNIISTNEFKYFVFINKLIKYKFDLEYDLLR